MVAIFFIEGLLYFLRLGVDRAVIAVSEGGPEVCCADGALHMMGGPSGEGPFECAADLGGCDAPHKGKDGFWVPVCPCVVVAHIADDRGYIQIVMEGGGQETLALP